VSNNEAKSSIDKVKAFIEKTEGAWGDTQGKLETLFQNNRNVKLLFQAIFLHRKNHTRVVF